MHERKVAGIAVSIGARVAAQAGPGEVLVSHTVKDLVAGSGLAFGERGEHELKGVPRYLAPLLRHGVKPIGSDERARRGLQRSL